MKTLKIDVVAHGISSMYNSIKPIISNTQKKVKNESTVMANSNTFKFKWNGAYEASLTK